MKDFLMAALPWIIVGMCIAILASQGLTKKKKRKKNKNEDLTDAKVIENNYLSEGMCIGMCLGVSFSQLLKFDIGTGLCIGMLLGEVIGSSIKKTGK